MQEPLKQTPRSAPVPLGYDTSGSGPSVLLVHGWCCDRTFMAPLTAHFIAKGHSVLAVDLRGHGASPAPAGDYAIEALADDIAHLCKSLSLERPLVVGHSMGGVVAYDLALRYPALAAAVVMLDAPLAMPQPVRASLERVLGGLRGPDYRRVLHAYVSKALFGANAAARNAALLAAMLETPQHVVVSSCEGMLAYDPARTPARLACPCLYVCADPALPRADIPRLGELIPALTLRHTVGAGHFCQLDASAEVAALIDGFLDCLTGSG